MKTKKRILTNHLLCFSLTSVLVFLTFSFSGLVVKFEDSKISCPLGAAPRKQNVLIDHGWPLVFIHRNCEFAGDQLLPNDLEETPPWMVWRLWDFSRENCKFSFHPFAIFADLICSFLFGLVVTLPIVFTAKVCLRSELTLRFICSATLCIATITWFISTLFLELKQVERYQTKCVAIGGNLENPVANDFYARIWGRKSVPSKLRYHNFVSAKSATSHEFRALLKYKAPWVDHLTAPEKYPIDDEFVELINKNYQQLTNLTLFSPEIETSKLYQMKGLESIVVVDGTATNREKIRIYFPAKVSFWGRVEE